MSFDEKALYNQEGLNVEEALSYLGSMDLYREILYDYYADIDSKTEAVRKAIAERDAKAYTVEVHAIKSSSRMIGASDLSQRAAMLEQYGDSEDWESILRETDGVLETYGSYKSIVAPYMVKSED